MPTSLFLASPDLIGIRKKNSMKENGVYSLNIGQRTFKIDPDSDSQVSQLVIKTIGEMAVCVQGLDSEIQIIREKSGSRPKNRNLPRSSRESRDILRISGIKGKELQRTLLAQRIGVLRNDRQGIVTFVTGENGEIVGLKVSVK